MKSEIVKRSEMPSVKAYSDIKYRDELDKLSKLAKDEMLKVDSESQTEITLLYYFFKRRGVKSYQRTRNGIISLYIAKE